MSWSPASSSLSLLGARCCRYRRYSEDGTLELNLIMAKLVLPMHDECIRVQPHCIHSRSTSSPCRASCDSVRARCSMHYARKGCWKHGHWRWVGGSAVLTAGAPLSLHTAECVRVRRSRQMLRCARWSPRGCSSLPHHFWCATQACTQCAVLKDASATTCHSTERRGS